MNRIPTTLLPHEADLIAQYVEHCDQPLGTTACSRSAIENLLAGGDEGRRWILATMKNRIDAARNGHRDSHRTAIAELLNSSDS